MLVERQQVWKTPPTWHWKTPARMMSLDAVSCKGNKLSFRSPTSCFALGFLHHVYFSSSQLSFRSSSCRQVYHNIINCQTQPRPNIHPQKGHNQKKKVQQPRKYSQRSIFSLYSNHRHFHEVYICIYESDTNKNLSCTYDHGDLKNILTKLSNPKRSWGHIFQTITHPCHFNRRVCNPTRVKSWAQRYLQILDTIHT